MKDPWKALAAVLGVGVLLAALWRFEPASTQDPHGINASPFLKEAAAPALDDLLPHAGAEVAIRPGVDATTPARVTLLARMTEDGKVLENAGCQLRMSDRTPRRGENFAGIVIFRDLAPGEYTLLGLGRGYYDQRETVRLAAAPDIQEHEMPLTRSALIDVVFLTPAGERLAVALRRDYGVADPTQAMPSIFATDAGGVPALPLARNDYRSPLATWNESSILGESDQPDGKLALRAAPPLLLHAMIHHVPIATRSLEAPCESLEWTLDPAAVAAALGSIRVRVLDPATGAPPEKGTLHLEGGGGWLGLIHQEDGWYQRTMLPPGVYRLNGFFGAKRLSVQATILPGETTILDGVFTRETGALEMQILGPDGSPARDAKLLLQAADSQDLFGTGSGYGAAADEHGRSSTPGIAAGRLLAMAIPAAASGLAPAWCEVEVPSARVAELVLTHGRSVFVVPSRELSYGESLCVLVDGRVPLLPTLQDLDLPARLRLASGSHAWALYDAGGRELRRGSFLVEQGEGEVRVEAALP